MRRFYLPMLGLLAAGCTSDTEWRARAAMAQAESAAQVAAAGARSTEAQARAAEAMVQAQADTATSAIWAAALPGILLLVAVVLLVIVGVWLWDRHSKRQAELKRVRLLAMMQMLAAPAPQQRKLPAQDYLILDDGHLLPVREVRQDRRRLPMLQER